MILGMSRPGPAWDKELPSGQGAGRELAWDKELPSNGDGLRTD